VALVLNRNSGHVSPQFHVKYDKSFNTVKQEDLDSTWQVATYFVENSNKRKATTNSEGVHDGSRMPHTPGVVSGYQTPRPPQQGAIDTLPYTDPRIHADPDDTQHPADGTPPTGTAGHGTTSQMGQRELDGALQTNNNQTKPQQTRYGRITRQPQRFIPVMFAQAEKNLIPGEIFCAETLNPDKDINSVPLSAYKATQSDPDSMYHHQAMCEPDKDQFIQGMQQEMDRQMEDGNFSIISRSKIPKGEKIFPAVWQMKRKRDIKTREVKSHKARIAFDGSRMEHGVHYDQVYAPVASWGSIRLMLALTAGLKWHSIQIDYVLAFPQAPVEREVYMEIPRGYELDDGKQKQDYALKLHANLYGQKQASRVWYQHLSKRLVDQVGFTKSTFDECVFFKGNVIYVLYTDDSLLVGPDREEIDRVIQQIREAKLNITVEGNIKDFLGVNINRKDDGTIEFTQPHLIDKILKALRLDAKATPKDTPASSSRILKRHTDSEPFDNSFHYRSVIGMMNYLDAGSRSDIAYATHQCARFANDPKREHGSAIRWLGRYLLGTRDKGMTFKPDTSSGLEVFVDADFAGNWDSKEANSDRDTARSRHGYIIRYMGCPIIWKSQLQTEIALSSTESEYTGLSYALRTVIPIMGLLNELQQHGFQVAPTNGTAAVHCRVFEDNSGALEMAKVHKFRPQTKHMNVRLHHFRSYVEDGSITIHPIASEDQLSDYLTKPLNVSTLKPLRKQILGW
jgi:hypothetical protein